MTPQTSPGAGPDDPGASRAASNLLKWMVVALLIMSGLDLRPVSAGAAADPVSTAVDQPAIRR